MKIFSKRLSFFLLKSSYLYTCRWIPEFFFGLKENERKSLFQILETNSLIKKSSIGKGNPYFMKRFACSFLETIMNFFQRDLTNRFMMTFNKERFKTWKERREIHLVPDNSFIYYCFHW